MSTMSLCAGIIFRCHGAGSGAWPRPWGPSKASADALGSEDATSDVGKSDEPARFKVGRIARAADKKERPKKRGANAGPDGETLVRRRALERQRGEPRHQRSPRRESPGRREPQGAGANLARPPGINTGEEPDIATNPDLEMQVDLIGESGRGNEGAACWGLD